MPYLSSPLPLPFPLLLCCRLISKLSGKTYKTNKGKMPFMKVCDYRGPLGWPSMSPGLAIVTEHVGCCVFHCYGDHIMHSPGPFAAVCVCVCVRARAHTGPGLILKVAEKMHTLH